MSRDGTPPAEAAVLDHVRIDSRPSDLRITDMRFTDVVGAPMHCTLLKIYTNQGIVGLGEVRDGASRTYAAMLKSRILGENPCDVDRLFRRIKQFGAHGRQAGGVCGVEVALWDLAGKAYGVPIYQMLGGRFRDTVRIYCDTHVDGGDPAEMGRSLKGRIESGFTFLKMDVGIGHLIGVDGALNAPPGFLKSYRRRRRSVPAAEMGDADRFERNRLYEIHNTAHPFTGIHITERGLDILEEYVGTVREIIGYEIPLAVDHIGHVPVEDGIRLARRMEKYSPAWLEDLIPWQYTDQYVRLRNATTAPICTGEDIYLKESFRPLLERGGVAVIHPDVLSAGGILETKKIGDIATDHGVAMALHMAESPVACMAAVHTAAASENFLALEFHSADHRWWSTMVTGLPEPLIRDGFIKVPDGPGLGIEDFDDGVLAEHLHPDFPGLWAPTPEWDHEWSHDRTWS